MKNAIISLTICAIMTATSLTALAAEKEPMLIASAPTADEMVIGSPQITVNGEAIDFSKSNLSQYIFETNGNTMVPLRAVAEKMGYAVDWDGENQAVTVGNDDWEVRAYIGEDLYSGVSKRAIGAAAPQNYGAAPQLIEDTTFVPAKMFELVGYNYNSVGQFVDFTKAVEENNVQIPNPFVPYENIDTAKSALTFNPSVPSYIPSGYKTEEITVVGNDFLQIIYINDSDEIIYYRTAVGNEDISGDYNIYTNTKMIKVGDLEVTARGNENISVAVWNAGDLTYSIQSDRELSEKEITLYIHYN